MKQSKFTEDDIYKMLSPPRRKQVTDGWTFITPPRNPSEDYRIAVLFDPLKYAFDEVFPNVSKAGWYSKTSHSFIAFLKNVSPQDIKEINEFFNNMMGSVAIRDCLPISFAIDFEREEGNPENDQTQVGALRSRAKPYGTELVQQSHYDAAKELADMTTEFIERVNFYNDLDAIIGMPSSDPDKEYKLTHILSEHISEMLNIDNLTNLVKKTRKTAAAKEIAVEKKLDAIRGSVEVSQKVEGRKILLLDDLYQSGVTMNYVAMLLLDRGAKKVYGLACEKTCRNDDNTSSC